MVLVMIRAFHPSSFSFLRFILKRKAAYVVSPFFHDDTPAVSLQIVAALTDQRLAWKRSPINQRWIMHLLLYLTASLVGDLRRTCQPTSHGRFEYHVERSFSSISYFSVSSLLFSPRFSRSSSVWSLSSPPPPLLFPVGRCTKRARCRKQPDIR